MIVTATILLSTVAMLSFQPGSSASQPNSDNVTPSLLGRTADQVMSQLGAPSLTSGTTWYYDTSEGTLRVVFKNGYVVTTEPTVFSRQALETRKIKIETEARNRQRPNPVAAEPAAPILSLMALLMAVAGSIAWILVRVIGDETATPDLRQAARAAAVFVACTVLPPLLFFGISMFAGASSAFDSVLLWLALLTEAVVPPSGRIAAPILFVWTMGAVTFGWFARRLRPVFLAGAAIVAVLATAAVVLFVIFPIDGRRAGF